MARSGRFVAPIAIIVSMRDSASRGAVGVHGRQRAVVARVHRLQHVERFLAADLADDDAVGAHAEGVHHELALADGALPFDVGRARLEPRDVLLVQLQLRRVFDRDDALAVGDEARQHVEQRRLAGAGAAADQTVEPRAHAVREKVEHRLRQRAQRDEVVGLQPLGRKTADRQQRAVHRQRRNDRVDARPVRKAGVDHRRAVVDAASDAADDAVDDAEQMPVILERGRDAFQHAVALDEDVLARVHEDVADGRVAQQRLERPEAEHVVEHLDEERLALAQVERRAFFGEELRQERRESRSPRGCDRFAPAPRGSAG